ELIAACVWWFNPLFWYVRHQLRNNAELACDAWVVATLPAGRRAYAEALIEVSQLSPLATPVLALGMGHSARHTFERRLTMILRERVAYRVPLLALSGIVLLGLAALPSFSIGQIFTQTQPKIDNVTAENAAPATNDPAGLPAEVSLTPVAVEGSTNAFVAQVQAVPTPGSVDRISEIEKRLEAMLAEVRALRQGGDAQGTWIKTSIVEAKPSSPADGDASTRATAGRAMK